MSLSPDSVPLIPRGVRLHRDEVRGLWVLLAPERAINLDQAGHAILSEIDGSASFGMIVDKLAAKFAAPAEAIAADAGEFITGLMDRRILDLRP